MKVGSWKVILGFALAAVLTLSAGWSATAWSRPGDFELVGTWRVTVTQADCSTGKTLSTFQSLLTFADGGTMAEDTTNLAFAPGQRSAGQGIWQYTGRRSYTAKSIAFINFDTLAPNPPKSRLSRWARKPSRRPSNSKMIPTPGAALRPYNLPMQREPLIRRVPCRLASLRMAQRFN